MARLGLKVCITLLGVLLAGGGCSKKGGTDPVPQRYRLYVGTRAGPPTWQGTYVLGFDCGADTLVDSLPLDELYDILFVTASPDGKYLAVRTPYHLEVFDLVASSKIRTLDSAILGVIFLPKEDYAIGTGRGNAKILSLPTFSIIDSLPWNLTGTQHLPGTTRLLQKYDIPDDQGRPFTSRFRIYDYSPWKVLDSFPVDTASGDLPVWVIRFSVSPDGTSLCALVADPNGTWIVGFDVVQKRLRFRHPYDASGGLGYCSLTPDGREIWYTHGANMFFVPWRESIHIIDAFSGTLVDTIDISSQRLNWPGPVSAIDIRFEPEQGKAYIDCGTGFSGPQPVVVVVAESRQIQRLIFADSSRVPQSIDIAIVP